MIINEWYYHYGGKKRARIKLFIKKGPLNVSINNININDYFNNNISDIYSLLYKLNIFNYIIKIYAYGGGKVSQLTAIKYSISCALKLIENNSINIINKYKYTTRDSRIVEKKKLGLRKARKNVQYSKR